jgi:glyoxylate carboligase
VGEGVVYADAAAELLQFAELAQVCQKPRSYHCQTVQFKANSERPLRSTDIVQ